VVQSAQSTQHAARTGAGWNDTEAQMRDNQYAGQRNNGRHVTGRADHGTDDAPAPAWQRIAQIPVPANAVDAAGSAVGDAALGDAIDASLPAALTSAGLRAAIQQAVLAALARRARQSGRLPSAVVISEQAGAARTQRGRGGSGWSFFVVERPAPGSQEAGEAIELFLYCEG
jgi:hypothetical protein